MIYLQLFWSFVKIGFTSFGGLSMVPLIRDEMLSHGWMTIDEVTDIVAIAEMTPGPLGYNSATFAGIRTAGVLGALAANLGVMVPNLTTALLVAAFFERFRKNTSVERGLTGIRPAVIGLLFGTVTSLSRTNYLSAGIDWIALLISAFALWLLVKKNTSIPKTILICAALGLVIRLSPLGALAP